MLGILSLDTRFPRIPGDVGCPETFPFPVRIEMIRDATVEDIVHRREATLLPAFIAGGRRLAESGCVGIATTCGFLARWQAELAAGIALPVLSSALLQVPLVERTLPHGRHVGIVTYSVTDLTPEALAAAGANPYAPIEGIDPEGYFHRSIRHGTAALDSARMEADVVAAARRLVGAHQAIGAIVLECANMPPYRRAVEHAVGIPVYDAAGLITWFYHGLRGAAPHYARRDLW